MHFLDIYSFSVAATIWIAIGVIVLPTTLFITAPFGRHTNSRFGPTIPNRLGWLFMESPAIWFFAFVFLSGASGEQLAAWFLFALWMMHYFHRGLIFPFRTRTSGKQIPVVIVCFAFVFQLVNAYLNGIALTGFGNQYSADWFLQPWFAIGLALFLIGAIVNVWSDNVLLRLRSQSESGYKTPHGFLFSKISCPNFLGEIIQWIGWAVMCWNLAALSFAIWTAANLVPRALAHHRWYREHLEDYPVDRKAVFPGLL